jgi:hypothetical protein
MGERGGHSPSGDQPALRISASTWPSQLINGFQLALFWSTNLRFTLANEGVGYATRYYETLRNTDCSK